MSKTRMHKKSNDLISKMTKNRKWKIKSKQKSSKMGESRESKENLLKMKSMAKTSKSTRTSTSNPTTAPPTPSNDASYIPTKGSCVKSYFELQSIISNATSNDVIGLCGKDDAFSHGTASGGGGLSLNNVSKISIEDSIFQ